MGSICSSGQINHPPRLKINPKNLLTISNEKELTISPGIFVKENSNSFYSAYSMDPQPLGSGSYGEVRKCIHLRSNDVRVVKIIAKAGLPQDVIESRSVFKEVEVLKAVDHPNLPRVYEFFEDGLNFYIVLELCKGGDLFDRIVQVTKFQENEASEIMEQILSGITYLHGRNILHRDIKPENILLEEKSSLAVKIIDFDTATFFGLGYQKGMFGTPLYMAPEIVKGKYTEKCDLWSCGMILYALLMGRPPYDGTDNEIIELLKNVKINVDKDCAYISIEGRDLLKKLLEPDPNKRISAAEACAHP